MKATIIVIIYYYVNVKQMVGMQNIMHMLKIDLIILS